MPLPLKINAVLVSVLSLAMLCFFQVSKHDADLSKINPFADDPYDSVSSFGVQFVLFLAALSLLRAFRPYPPSADLTHQGDRITRGGLMAVTAILVISLSNTIALCRHLSTWYGVQGGLKLAWVTAGLLSITVVAGWSVYRPVRSRWPDRRRTKWQQAFVTVGAAAAVLFFYPEELRRSLWGELFTVLVGIGLLFLPVWAIDKALISDDCESEDDLIDDVTSIYRSVKSKTPFFAPAWAWIERPWTLDVLVDLVNPRRHRWNLPLLLGGLLGAALFSVEVIFEGASAFRGRLLLLTAVFTGLEMAGIATGYALLSLPLQLFRHDADREK